MKESRKRIWLLIVALAILLNLVGCTTEPIEDKAMASQAALPEIETESAAEEIPMTEETEPPILEGELFLKGKLRVVTFVKIFIKVYFDKNLKRLIQLCKKEAV